MVKKCDYGFAALRAAVNPDVRKIRPKVAKFSEKGKRKARGFFVPETKNVSWGYVN